MPGSRCARSRARSTHSLPDRPVSLSAAASSSLMNSLSWAGNVPLAAAGVHELTIGVGGSPDGSGYDLGPLRELVQWRDRHNGTS